MSYIIKNKKIDKYPIKILLAFLIFTELFFWIGPIEYRLKNSFLLGTYLLILNVCLYLGYMRGIQNFKCTTYNLSKPTLRIFIICGFCLTFLNVESLWKSHGVSISLGNLISAISNPGEAYYAESDTEISTNYLTLILSPIVTGLLPVGIYYWYRIKKIGKILIISSVLLTMIGWLGIGVRKGLMDIIVISFFCIYARLRGLEDNLRLKRRLMFIAVFFISIFILYFIFSNISRYGGDGFAALEMINNTNLKSWYINQLGTPISVALSFIESYLCQGYYALGLGLDHGIILPSIFGSNWFTIAFAKKFGYDPTIYTYTYILQNQGIDMSINWHSLYLWLANDFTFIGVPLIVFFIGYFFAQTWCDCVRNRNVLAYPIMSLFVIMIFYAFANNQVFSFSFIPFVVWFSLYKLKSHISRGL